MRRGNQQLNRSRRNSKGRRKVAETNRGGGGGKGGRRDSSKNHPHLVSGVMLIQKGFSTLEFCNLFIMK
jgi:hypothetical protein